MASTWTLPGHAAPFNVGTALLLTDGTVFAQDDFTLNWWRLAPDASGAYASGTWTRAAPAKRRRLYFASAVLADGRVFVAGGEYADDANTQADLLAAEIYDPLKDIWTDLPVPEGWTVLGDAPCCVLADGTVLVGNINTGECAIFDPARNGWRATGRKGNGSARGETWTLLADGSVLSADCVGHPRSERFLAGAWQDAGAVAPDLVENVSSEIGPAILMADGRVLALGATGQTAIYTPGAPGGAWSAGPPLPIVGGLQMAAKDAPACLLPNGRVLLVAGGVDGTKESYGASIVVYESDARAAPVAAPVPPVVDVAPYSCRLLLLPNGQAMLSTSTPALAFYDSDPPADDAGRPTISQAPLQVQAGGAYVLRGRGLNGLSQACAYGDDASMATNYPLVRLTSQSIPVRVTYCRTAGHSTMGVATGASEEATNFTVPDTVAAGKYTLSVVANGIASLPRAVVVEASPARGEPLVEAAALRNVTEDKRLQEEMLWRDLNEVHLLMDFISGQSEKSLNDLGEVPNPEYQAPIPGVAPMPGPNAMAVLPSVEALRRVCVIRFPPEGTPEEKARQAALLLLVKDRLNRLACPARGLTIAFTSMVAGTSGSTKDDAAWRSGTAWGRPDWLVFLFGEMRHRARHHPAVRQVTGFSIAAYPNLESQARHFKVTLSIIPYVALLWLGITALVYWDVAMSSQALRNSIVGITVSDKDCNIDPQRQTSIAAVPDKLKVACNALLAAEKAGLVAADIVVRDGRTALFDTHWRWHPVGWIVRKYGPSSDEQSAMADDSGPCALPGSCDYEADVTAFTTVVVSVFTDYILPMMFGVLGTLAGLIRSVSAKIRDSTLAPRDYRLMFSLIPLGAVAGLAVGLVVTPSSTTSVAAGIPLTLSAAGLAFLAGYGADAFFGMIDGVLTRVFTVDPPPPAGGSK